MDFTLRSEDRAYGDDRHDHAADVPRARGAKVAAKLPATTVGAGWYHEAAIEAARQSAIELRCNPYGDARP